MKIENSDDKTKIRRIGIWGEGKWINGEGMVEVSGFEFRV
jgi:hypothetical protein